MRCLIVKEFRFLPHPALMLWGEDCLLNSSVPNSAILEHLRDSSFPLFSLPLDPNSVTPDPKTSSDAFLRMTQKKPFHIRGLRV